MRAHLVRIARLTYCDVLPTDNMIDVRFLAETALAATGHDPGGPWGSVRRPKAEPREPR